MGRALIVVNGNTERARAANWCQKAPAGTRIEFKAPKRTIPQNDLMWVMLGEVSRQVVWYGQKLSADDWKDVFTASLRKARVVPGLDAGSFVPLGMRTSDMSKAEMSDLIELMASFGADPEHPVDFASARQAEAA